MTADATMTAADGHAVAGQRRKWRPSLSLRAYLLIAPSLLLLILFTYGPVVEVLYSSLTVKGVASLGHYRDLFSDADFYQAVTNNIIYGLATVLPSLIMAFLLALGLKKTTLFTTILRSIFFFPTLMPLVAAASIFLFIFMPRIGLADYYLAKIGVDGFNWLGNPDVVLYSLAVLTVWKNAGYYMMFFLAGLMALPEDVYESARLDGAGPIRRTVDFTIPLLKPTFSFVTVIALTHVLTDVDHVFVLTKGGPSGSSNLMLFYIYQQAMENFDAGRAAAATVVSVAAMMALSIGAMTSIEHRMHTET
jgi:sn-glycerol 3-phosphate transport system permease protein